tara:strand:+ start:1261 stop:2337 length:1077 start_codon:yes stop_codon:yes gene_type:complete
MKVLILGCGSIGNHLANASRRMDWEVSMCDVDPNAIKRTKDLIYPSRYGGWDDKIKFIEFPTSEISKFDMVIVGTPPDTHIDLAIQALKIKPKCILIEKPLCGLDFSNIDQLINLANEENVKLFIGYDHSLSKAIAELKRLLDNNNFGKVETIDVDFREEWSGIFAAHPWLDGPSDSYLGYSKRGGGAAGEHSHGIHLWQYLSKISGQGTVTSVNCTMKKFKDSNVDYDKLSIMNFKTDKGLLGKCVQDVITKPSKKSARVQFDKGFLKVSFTPKLDIISYSIENSNDIKELRFEKDRPSDFILELTHIDKCIKGDFDIENSPISINHGLDVMKIIKTAHISNDSNSIEFIKPISDFI